MNALLFGVVVTVLYLLHQDVWFWRQARPLVFGFLPVGLAYHGAYCLAVSLLMWWLTRTAWPAHLELAPPPHGTSADAPAGATRQGGRR